MSAAFCETPVAECTTSALYTPDWSGTSCAASDLVPDRAQDRDGDRVDILVYFLWAAVLLVLLRYV